MNGPPLEGIRVLDLEAEAGHADEDVESLIASGVARAWDAREDRP